MVGQFVGRSVCWSVKLHENKQVGQLVIGQITVGQMVIGQLTLHRIDHQCIHSAQNDATTLSVIAQSITTLDKMDIIATLIMNDSIMRELV
jgi:hypothetical protein